MSEATSLAPAASLEVLSPAKQGIRVEFRWTGDRFSHTLLSLRDGQAVPLFESVEGTSADRFPPSPTLVELHQQDEAIFLTGATKAGHWSMSVEPVNLSKQSPSQFLLFDVACRLRKQSETLRSKYQSVSESVQCRQSDQGVLVHCDPEYTAFLAATQQVDCQAVCDSNSQKTTISPTCERQTVFPTTIRWRYGVFINPA